MYIMAFNGPPPPAPTLTKTKGYKLPNEMSSNNYARLRTDIITILNHPNLEEHDKQELLNLETARNVVGIRTLNNMVKELKNRLGLQGGRRRRRRTRCTHRNKKSKRSTRRR